MDHLLKSKKISETPFRKQVLDVFRKYSNAIPISVIEEELQDYNRITLYRTIKTFVEKGIIHEIAISGGVSNYATCKEECTTTNHQHHHIHFKCTKCEKIYCVAVKQFPDIELPDYQIDNLEIQATGRCKNCY